MPTRSNLDYTINDTTDAQTERSHTPDGRNKQSSEARAAGDDIDSAEILTKDAETLPLQLLGTIILCHIVSKNPAYHRLLVCCFQITHFVNNGTADIDSGTRRLEQRICQS